MADDTTYDPLQALNMGMGQSAPQDATPAQVFPVDNVDPAQLQQVADSQQAVPGNPMMTSDQWNQMLGNQGPTNPAVDEARVPPAQQAPVDENKAKLDAVLAKQQAQGVGGSGLTPELQKLLLKMQQPGQGNGTPDLGFGQYNQAVREARNAIAAQTHVEQAKADANAQVAQKNADLQDKFLADQQAKEAERQKIYDTQIRQAQDMMTKFNNISTVVDPSRYWADKSTSQKISASLGLFLGGLGSGMTGGPNQALQLVQHAIDNDIDAQKQTIQGNIEKGRQGIQNSMTMLSMYREKFHDDATAEALTRATMLERASQMAKAQLARLDNPAAVANGQAAVAKLDAEAAAEKQKAGQWMADYALRKQQGDRENAQFALSLTGMGKQSPETFVPGLGYALDKDAAKTLREKKTTFQNLDGLLQKAEAMREKYGSEDIGQHKAEMKSLGAQIKVAINKNEGLSRLSEADLNILEQMTNGDLTSWGYVAPALKLLRKNVNDSFMNEAGNYLMPGTAGGPTYATRKPGG